MLCVINGYCLYNVVRFVMFLLFGSNIVYLCTAYTYRYILNLFVMIHDITHYFFWLLATITRRVPCVFSTWFILVAHQRTSCCDPPGYPLRWPNIHLYLPGNNTYARTTYCSMLSFQVDDYSTTCTFIIHLLHSALLDNAIEKFKRRCLCLSCFACAGGLWW